MTELVEALRQRPYPGRGCVAARLGDDHLYLGYFLTGRSQASRSRTIALQPQGDVQVTDTSGGDHDSLRHYVAAVRRGGWTVVGNGDQVEPLGQELAAGTDPATAWAAHTYEPDPPIFTPRIWLAFRHADSALMVGSAGRSERADGSPDRLLWMPAVLPVGAAVLLTTYAATAEEVRTSGTPASVTTTAAGPADLLNDLWTALDPALAVAAFVAPADELPAALIAGGPTV
jgi:IMP cyclohydrolase